MPLTFVKIDRSFVQGLQIARNQRIVAAAEPLAWAPHPVGPVRP